MNIVLNVELRCYLVATVRIQVGIKLFVIDNVKIVTIIVEILYPSFACRLLQYEVQIMLLRNKLNTKNYCVFVTTYTHARLAHWLSDWVLRYVSPGRFPHGTKHVCTINSYSGSGGLYMLVCMSVNAPTIHVKFLVWGNVFFIKKKNKQTPL